LHGPSFLNGSWEVQGPTAITSLRLFAVSCIAQSWFIHVSTCYFFWEICVTVYNVNGQPGNRQLDELSSTCQFPIKGSVSKQQISTGVKVGAVALTPFGVQRYLDIGFSSCLTDLLSRC